MFMNELIIFFGTQFQYIVIAALLLFLFFGKSPQERKKNRFMVLGALCAAALSRLALTELIRFFYHRPRPFIFYDFVPLISHDPTSSFPSGHAAFFFGIAWYISFTKPHWSIPFFISALLIGAVRVLGGIHYPTDILGGVVVGFVGAWIVRRTLQNFKENAVSRDTAAGT